MISAAEGVIPRGFRPPPAAVGTLRPPGALRPLGSAPCTRRAAPGEWGRGAGRRTQPSRIAGALLEKRQMMAGSFLFFLFFFSFSFFIIHICMSKRNLRCPPLCPARCAAHAVPAARAPPAPSLPSCVQSLPMPTNGRGLLTHY